MNKPSKEIKELQKRKTEMERASLGNTKEYKEISMDIYEREIKENLPNNWRNQ